MQMVPPMLEPRYIAEGYSNTVTGSASVAVRCDILCYYRSLGSDPNIVETTDLLKAADDWSRNITPPGYTSPITTQQLLALADEWSKST